MLQTLPAETATTTWTQAKAVIRVYENSATSHKQLQVAQEAVIRVYENSATSHKQLQVAQRPSYECMKTVPLYTSNYK